MRLWIDDRVVIDEWNSNPGKTFRPRLNFPAHSRHRIRMEYFQGEWDSLARLAWELPPDPTTLSWTSEAGDAVDYYFIFGPELDRSWPATAR